jgi:hypothetical protein
MKSSSPRPKGTIPTRRQRPRLVEAGGVAFAARNGFCRSGRLRGFFSRRSISITPSRKPGASIPEVLEVLEALRDHPVDLAVLTNWDARLHAVLDGNGLGEYLHASSARNSAGKSPIRRFTGMWPMSCVVQPGAVLSVGDDSRNDVEGPAQGRMAGGADRAAQARSLGGGAGRDRAISGSDGPISWGTFAGAALIFFVLR